MNHLNGYKTLYMKKKNYHGYITEKVINNIYGNLYILLL